MAIIEFAWPAGQMPDTDRAETGLVERNASPGQLYCMDDNELLASHNELRGVLRTALRELRAKARRPNPLLIQRIRDVLTDAGGVAEKYRIPEEATVSGAWEITDEGRAAAREYSDLG